MVKRIHADGVDRDMTPEEETANDASVAKWKTEADAAKVIEDKKIIDKASAKAKLIAGEALTEAEADAIVI